MAGGMDLGGSGSKGKKPLDTTINLVPFIDLMAVTIVFLIMSAVWTQLRRLQVSQQGQDEGPAPLTDPLPITVLLTEHLKKVKQEQPDQTAITLSTEDGVKYEDLVRVIDACIGSQFPSVSVLASSNSN